MARILLVEDDPAVSFGLTELLKKEQHEVTACMNGEDALKEAARATFDAVLLDISLPGINGYEVCRGLRENHFLNPVIMLSARAMPVDRVVGLEVGADDYMTKPFEPRELTARIAAHLRRTERLRNESHEEGERRHLLAVMFTDICGYSRVMNEDERLGLRMLEEHNVLMREAIESNEGDVVEIIGDAFLARFESAVHAVHAAVNALRVLAERNAPLPGREHIRVRIGVHIGDVMDYGRSLKGDAVNIAARIQQHAQPDAICISDDVHKIIARKTDFVFQEQGEQRLKNISGTLKLWTVNWETS